MNCKHCGYPYSIKNGELWCPFCVLLTEIAGLKDRISEMEITINGYDFPKTHSELTRGTFDGVAKIMGDVRLLAHDVKLNEQNLKKLYDQVNKI